VLASFEKYDQPVMYMNTDDYTRFPARTVRQGEGDHERLGLALKGVRSDLQDVR